MNLTAGNAVTNAEKTPERTVRSRIAANLLVFLYAVLFGMGAYGVVKLLIFASDRLGLPF